MVSLGPSGACTSTILVTYLFAGYFDNLGYFHLFAGYFDNLGYFHLFAGYFDNLGHFHRLGDGFRRWRTSRDGKRHYCG